MIKGEIIATASKCHKPNVLLSIPKTTLQNIDAIIHSIPTHLALKHKRLC